MGVLLSRIGASLPGLRLVVVMACVASLILLTLSAVGLGARGNSLGSTNHLIVVPNSVAGNQALTASDARVVARYRSFVLVDGDRSDVTRLKRVGGVVRDDMRLVRLGGRAVDLATDRPPLAGKRDRSVLERSGAGLVLVQFVGPIQDRWLDDLRATGVTVVSYMAENAYLVYAPTGNQQVELVDLQARSPEVRAVTRYTARDKFTAEPPKTGSANVAVQTVRGSPGAATRKVIAGVGEIRGALTRVAGFATQRVRLTSTEINGFSRDPEVVAIVPEPERKLLDERAAQIVAGNIFSNQPSGTGYMAALTAFGFPATPFDFVVDITDEGLDKGIIPVPSGSHPDFYIGGNTGNASRIVYQQEATSDTNARDCGGHGTNVASIATGYNDGTGATVEDASGYNYGLGIAPRAQLGGTKIFTCAGAFQVQTSFTALQGNAYANGARVSNNSWGSDTSGGYNIDSQEYDAIVRDAQTGVGGNQQITEVFAAGNAGSGLGSVGAPGTAKNVITVGASENVRPIGGSDGCGVPDADSNDVRDIVWFSSRGPVSDGRRKPDIVAPGTHVSGAQPQTGGDYNGLGTCNPQFPAGSTLYTLVSGTSQATPEATGFAALLRDWYQRTIGGGTTPPSPAMIKALMVNSASDQVGGSNGDGGTNPNVPDNTQGWGRINLKNALDSVARVYVDQPTASTFSASGESYSQTYAVQDTTKPVKVSLVWTDAPGPLTGAAYVNNLDLSVASVSGSFRGNVFSGGYSGVGGSADPRNNVENVFVPAGTAGSFSVKIDATNIAGDGVPNFGDATDQDFALVVSNAAPTTASVLAHVSTAITDLGDNDGAVEPGESFEISEQVRNSGNASATAVTGTVSTAFPDLTISQPTSSYPDMPVGATGSNGSAYSATLDAGATCGSEPQLSLSFQTSAGARGTSFKIPTGVSGAPVTRGTGTTSIAIPDNSSAGATSVLNVTDNGIIRDVNVRIGITHTWVEDLDITLIGPDGTTVLLATDVGGSGDNFTNTVFDDETATNIAAGAPPFTGSFKPESDQLSRLDGKQMQGNWQLEVVDDTEFDSGTITSFGHDVSIAECASGPETAIDSGPPQGGTTSDATPTFTFSSPAGGVTFECKVDLGAFTACSAPEAAHTTTALADGSHTFSVRAVSAGPLPDSTPATRTFTVDATAPETVIVDGPATGSITEDLTPTFTFSSLEVGATFECRTDGSAWTACTSPFTTAPLTLAAHTVEVRAVDAVGNTDTSPASRTFTVVAPQVVPPPATQNPAIPAPAATNQPPDSDIILKKKKLKVKKLKSISGTATDDVGVTGVEVAIIKLASGAKPAAKKTKSCLALQPTGKLKRKKAKKGKCAPTVWLKASGTTKWKFKLRKPLPKGSYVVYSRAVDNANLKEVSFSDTDKNRVTIKLI